MKYSSRYFFICLVLGLLILGASAFGIELVVEDNYGPPSNDVTLSLLLKYGADELLSPELLKSLSFTFNNYVQSGLSGDTTLIQVVMPLELDGTNNDLHGVGTPDYTGLVPASSNILANTTMSNDFDSYFYPDPAGAPTALKIIIAPKMTPATYPTFLGPTVTKLLNVPVHVGSTDPSDPSPRKGQKILLKVDDLTALKNNNTFISMTATAGNFWIGTKGDVDIINDVGNDVDLFDVLRIVDIAIGNISPNSYETWAADLDSDGLIDVADVGIAMDLAVGNAPTSAFYPPANVSGAAAFTLEQPVAQDDGLIEIPVTISASEAVRGVQMVLEADPTVYKIDGIKKASIVQEMEIVQKTIDGQLSLLILDKAGKSIVSGNHTLFTIAVRAKKNSKVKPIEIKSVSVASANGQAMQTSWDTRANLAGTTIPSTFALHQNSPNPFNMSTTIQYDVPQLEEMPNVTLSIFNINGQLVRTLVNQTRSAGSYAVTWDGTDESGQFVATGIYFYQMQANDFVMTKKMAVTK